MKIFTKYYKFFNSLLLLLELFISYASAYNNTTHISRLEIEIENDTSLDLFYPQRHTEYPIYSGQISAIPSGTVNIGESAEVNLNTFIRNQIGERRWLNGQINMFVDESGGRVTARNITFTPIGYDSPYFERNFVLTYREQRFATNTLTLTFILQHRRPDSRRCPPYDLCFRFSSSKK